MPQDDLNENIWITVSTAISWQPIALFFTDAFSDASQHHAPIYEFTDQLFSHDQTAEDYVKSAVNFIRYNMISLESVSDPFIPIVAYKTLMTRTGDCKSKVALFIALLGEKNIKAYPILTNTKIVFDFSSLLPSPHIFNHSIAMVPQQNGLSQDQFIDLTQNDMLTRRDHLQGLLLNGDESRFINFNMITEDY